MEKLPETRFTKRVTLVTIGTESGHEFEQEFQGSMSEPAVNKALQKIYPFSFTILKLEQVKREYVTDNFTLDKEYITKKVI